MFSIKSFGITLAVLWAGLAGYVVGVYSVADTHQGVFSRDAVAERPVARVTTPIAPAPPLLVEARQSPRERSLAVPRPGTQAAPPEIDATVILATPRLPPRTSSAPDRGAAPDPAERLAEAMSLSELSDADQIARAIRRLEPSLVPAEEREAIVSVLRNYLVADAAAVRSAAVEAVGAWGGEMEADIIETALFDEAEQVRRAALFTAFTSTIRSEGIKESLADIMTNDGEPWELRMEAYTALSSYSLEDDLHDEFYAFDAKRAAVYDTPPDDS